MVVGKSLEEFYSLQVMIVASSRRLGLTRPVNRDVLSMTLPEGTHGRGATPYDAPVCFPLAMITLGSRANLPRYAEAIAHES